MIHQALNVDNDIYIKSRQEKNTITSQIDTTSLASFLQTVDDYLACVTIAENILEKKS
jgi:hypothetical protein